MKNFKLIKPILTFALSFALSAEVMAFGNPAEFDLNGDGIVTAEETQTSLAALFTKIDTNADKFLSLAEMQAWRSSVQVERFKTLDTDNSTTLTLAELQASTSQKQFHDAITEKVFNLLDSDQSSALSWEEYAVLEPGKGHLIRHFAQMDANDDMQISEAEFLTQPTREMGDRGGHGGHRSGR